MAAPTLIGTIPAEMKLQIMYKMPTVPLCRMRRTCSQMNSLVEENKKKLANRARIGLSMEIVSYDNNIWFKAASGPQKFLVDDHFFEKISAISFRSLIFDLIENRRNINRDQFSNFVQNMIFTCDSGKIYCNNEEFVNELLNGITARIEMCVFYLGNSNERFLTHINQTPKHEGIFVTVFTDLEITALFDLIKDYEEFRSGNVKQSDFNVLLQEMRLCKEPFIIKKIVCATVPDSLETAVRADPPLMKTLWDISLLPPDYQFQSCPTRISQMDLANGKCALLENKDFYPNCIYIVNNDLTEIFNTVMEALYIEEVDEEILQAYIRADEEQRQGLLLTALVDDVNERPRRRED